MSSTDELLREIESEDTSTRTTSSDAPASDTRRARAKERAVGVFSPKHFVSALLFMAGGFVLGGFVPLLPGVVGILLAGFAFGLVSSGRRYLETGIAGGIVSAIGFFLFNPAAFAIGLANGPQAALVMGGIGLLAAVVGTYFGRDLKSGLTADIGE
ncbi:hypothetical protein ACFPYI_14355 [Halomarina salina]|uniref:DUF456 domain-containing protein n=1 Tax=Halomarina salina TaxID=1872699 RepID=A0ABD5RQ45_9EURY|nr:hypothetical protein [Halomarina salina]